MTQRWDVLGIGCSTVDELLYVPHFPLPDSKLTVTRRERQCGGLTATALVAAARQGARCAYGGALGDDPQSDFVRAALAAEGIDLSPSPVHPDAAPIHATIIVDQGAHTRTVLNSRPEIVGALPDAPAEAQIQAARVLLVDHYGGAATVRAQQVARAAGIPVVADLERDDRPEFADILALTDHLVLSARFAARLTGCDDPLAAARALLPGRSVVVVTRGADGAVAVARELDEPLHQPAFAVEVVDTTGCGDTFHGVYCAELAGGAALGQRLRRAAAAAALKALAPGAQRGIPDRRAVDRFLERGS
jgi:sugar/nucleoside kinase (ribokinase family)